MEGERPQFSAEQQQFAIPNHNETTGITDTPGPGAPKISTGVEPGVTGANEVVIEAGEEDVSVTETTEQAEHE